MEPTLLTRLHLSTSYVNETDAHLWLSAYQEDKHVPALFLTRKDRDQIAVATVNLAGYGLYPEEGNVFIKDWSENEGILATLIENNVISEPVRTVPSGYQTAYECTLLLTSTPA